MKHYAGLLYIACCSRHDVQSIRRQNKQQLVFEVMSASEIGDSKVFESTLNRVATFRAPVGNNVGKYTLKDECWREIDIYFLHWTKMDQVKAVTNYSSFYDYKIKQDPIFKAENDFPESPFYPAIQKIKNKPMFLALDKMPSNVLLNPMLHEVLFGALFNSLNTVKIMF